MVKIRWLKSDDAEPKINQVQIRLMRQSPTWGAIATRWLLLQCLIVFRTHLELTRGSLRDNTLTPDQYRVFLGPNDSIKSFEGYFWFHSY